MEKWLGMTLWHSRDSGQAQREVVPPEAPRRRAAGVFGGSAPDQTGSGKAEVRWKSWCFFRWSVSSSCFGLELCFSNGQTAIRRRLVSDLFRGIEEEPTRSKRFIGDLAPREATRACRSKAFRS